MPPSCQTRRSGRMSVRLPPAYHPLLRVAAIYVRCRSASRMLPRRAMTLTTMYLEGFHWSSHCPVAQAGQPCQHCADYRINYPDQPILFSCRHNVVLGSSHAIYPKGACLAFPYRNHENLCRQNLQIRRRRSTINHRKSQQSGIGTGFALCCVNHLWAKSGVLL